MSNPHTPEASRGAMATANRYAPLLNGCSLVLLAASLLSIVRQLPVGPLIDMLQDWIATFGVWGPPVFALFYVAAALLLVPGSALTLAAGAIFGLAFGTLTTSLAATMAAGLAFSIARKFARKRIARNLRHYPRFNALDRAVSAGGWKIVALLRLSPVVPFTLQNYLYGLTGIRFGPYLLTSWLAMLPGTFLYVYLGHVGRAGIEAAGGERSRSPAEWTLMIAGLLATVAATVYITRLARKELRQHGVIEDSPARAVQGWPWGATLLAVVALAAFIAAVYVHLRPEVLQSLFGK